MQSQWNSVVGNTQNEKNVFCVLCAYTIVWERSPPTTDTEMHTIVIVTLFSTKFSSDDFLVWKKEQNVPNEKKTDVAKYSKGG